jgi:hypothetical protein
MLNHSLSTPILSLQKGGQFAAILRGQFVRLFHWKVENGKVNLSISYLIKILEFHNLDLLSFFKIVDLSIRK